MEYDGAKFLARLKAVAGNKTQEAIAVDLGVQPATISRWKNKVPNTDVLLTAAEKYHCSIDYLLGVTVDNRASLSLRDTVRDLLIYKALHPDLIYGDKVFFEAVHPSSYAEANDGALHGQITVRGSVKENWAYVFDKFNECSKAFQYLPDNQKIGIIDSILDEMDTSVERLPFT